MRGETVVLNFGEVEGVINAAVEHVGLQASAPVVAQKAGLHMALCSLKVPRVFLWALIWYIMIYQTRPIRQSLEP